VHLTVLGDVAMASRTGEEARTAADADAAALLPPAVAAVSSCSSPRGMWPTAVQK
jgi:hypothetical protein